MTRILVVDDEPQVQQTLAAFLEDEGFETLVADSVVKAIEVLETERIHLAIVDIMMPGVDGLEAVKAISRLKPKVPVVAMSGRMLQPPCEEFDGMRVLATRLGADYCLGKSFTQHDVRAAVQACMAG